MKKEEYLKNPTKMSAVSFWKTNNIKVPKNILVLNQYSFKENLLKEYNDDEYFKLSHDIKKINVVKPENFFEFSEVTNEELLNHINSCYEDIKITLNDLENMRGRETYDEDLWFSLVDKRNSKIVATAISEFDKEIKEGYLDWIQVSIEYRNMGLGKAIVNETLNRLKNKADFATVSGRINDKSNPLRLYESCGFENKIIWHILFRK